FRPPLCHAQTTPGCHLASSREQGAGQGGSMSQIHGRVISVALLSMSLGFSVGCSRHASDGTMSQDIQDKVAADPDTKDSKVTVAAKNGRVTLNGTVKTAATR